MVEDNHPVNDLRGVVRKRTDISHLKPASSCVGGMSPTKSVLKGIRQTSGSKPRLRTTHIISNEECCNGAFL